MKGVFALRDQSDFYKTIGTRIREIRVSKGVSQADLAERAKLSPPVISNLENGHSKIWLITFAKVCEALQVSANDILRLDTPAAINDYPQEFTALISDCNSSEIESILKIAKEVKLSLKKQKQEY